MEEANVSKDAVLLQALQRFVTLISSGGSGGQNGVGINLSKNIAFFLRLHLLSQMRQIQSEVQDGEEDLSSEGSLQQHEQQQQRQQQRQKPHRDVLIQWWITLLNYLNSDLNSSMLRQQSMPTVDTISVTLESISRIITILMLTDSTDQREFEIYSHHLLLTVHYITNRLVENSKKRKTISQNTQLPAAQMKAALVFIQAYNNLLRAFMGKVVAYAYFYLPNSINYDFQVLRFLCNNIKVVRLSENVIVPWKTVQYELAEDTDLEQQAPLNAQSLNYLKAAGTVPGQEDLRIFQVMISYLQNEQVFSTFYWHYWYILLQLHLSAGQIGGIKFEHCPGLSICMDYVGKFLNKDLPKFSQYMRTQDLKEMPLTPNNNGSVLATKLNNLSMTLTSDKLNNYIYSKFQTIKLWECLRNLVGCFRKSKRTGVDNLLHALIREHDLKQLNTISKIPAYDSMVGNLVFNKLLQFIIFQFSNSESCFLADLNWPLWIKGIEGMLWTLNSNCQSTALLCLFNIWDYIPVTVRVHIQEILTSDLWYNLSTETDFHMVRVLFMKLVVFRIVPDPELDSVLIKSRLEATYNDALELNKHIILEDDDINLRTILTFNVNKKLALVSNETVTEDDLMLEERKKYESTGTSSQHPTSVSPTFPLVSSLANVRPSVVLMKGKYPFDVFDEMVTRAAFAMAEKRKKQRAELEKQRQSRRSSWNSSDDFGVEGNTSTNSNHGVVSAWSTIISKLSPYHKQSNIPSGSSSPVTGTVGGSSRGEDILSTESMDSESGEILSMYSSASQISSVTNSSDDFGPSKRFATGSRGSVSCSRSQESLLKGQKKRKLFAPPELKYSAAVTESAGISRIFRLTTTQVPVHSGSFATALIRLRDANEKWGIKNNQLHPYDKPLPSSPDAPELGNDTLIDGFDFESLYASAVDEIPEMIDLSSRTSTNNNESTISVGSITSDQIPQPNWNFFIIFHKRSNSNIDDIDTIGNATITDSKFAPENTVDVSPCPEEAAGPDNCDAVLPIEEMQNEYSTDLSSVYSEKKQQTIRMLQATKMRKLLRLILTYNCTVKEFLDYVNRSSVEDQGGQLFMEFDIGSQANRHVKSNKDCAVNAFAAYE
ncbi:Ahk1p Ecym_3251 [Eremothecium cymbalariae DBVPG|uniref:Uncharacterized protein n=1 Tax=Eremothecium cymbalariae (strain CBS 270.75 / DBVPG 7215 / KCTC 17166 / NRRL Y-17582) TaxID=931890 RepID=G8JRH5_ERECY|nr:Hypothetical protein Ecym_3251 [Eremothecium cymbalariae DBVPG\